MLILSLVMKLYDDTFLLPKYKIVLTLHVVRND